LELSVHFANTPTSHSRVRTDFDSALHDRFRRPYFTS
jgi:hypothetical protein